MPSYCLLNDIKTYLNVTTSTDDELLQLMLDAATARIDSFCGRTFQAASDEARYFSIQDDIVDGSLILDTDLSYITSIVNGDAVDVTQYVTTNPRNVTPYYSMKFQSSAPTGWQASATDDYGVAITGRWAWMERAAITALSRATNIVTATVKAPRISVGQSVFVAGCADASFDGAFTVISNTGNAITWAQTAADDTDTTAVLLNTPLDIVTACRRLAAWLYRQKDTQMGDGDRPILAGDGSVIMPSTLPQDVTMLLRAYTKRL